MRERENLEREVEQLREALHYMREAMGVDDLGWIPEFGLTPREKRMFAVMVQNPQPTRDALIATRYFDYRSDEIDRKSLHVFISTMRPKLLKHGIAIRTRWGCGYHLDTHVRNEMRKLKFQYQQETRVEGPKGNCVAPHKLRERQQ